MSSSPQNIQKSGTLILVVGPSGSGKDTLISLVKNELADDRRFIFPRRVITRQALASAEDHDTMRADQFSDAVAAREFALHWQAHGLSYGIRRTDIDMLANGKTVIVNVSRSVIGKAETLGYPVIVLSILCKPEILAKRIAARGRETKDEILLRLTREARLIVTSAECIEIRNDAELDQVAAEFISIIRATQH